MLETRLFFTYPDNRNRMTESLRLIPSRKQDIASLLVQSYDCVLTDCEWKTTAKELKNFPSFYIKRILEPHTRPPNDWMQKMMDWSSWEIARSALDESIKNSVGLLLYVDKINELKDTPLREMIGEFDPKYISNFAPGVLYFCHLHSVLAGLAFAGFLIREARFVARVSIVPPRWRCINESWVEDSKTEMKRKPQKRVFEQYDAIQSSQMSWLPERPKDLKMLKQVRETMTYKTERMGGWQDTDSIESIKKTFPNHLLFQEALLNLLCKAVEGKPWNRSYDPCARTKPLRSRFKQYKDLARRLTGPWTSIGKD